MGSAAPYRPERQAYATPEDAFMSLTIFHEGFTGELGLGAYNAISGFIPEILDKGR